MFSGSDRQGAVRVHLGAGANEEGDVVGQVMLCLPKGSQPGGQLRHLPVELGELVGVLRHGVRRWAIGGRLLVEVESPLVGDVVVVWARGERPLDSRPRATVPSTGSAASAALAESSDGNLA